MKFQSIHSENDLIILLTYMIFYLKIIWPLFDHLMPIWFLSVIVTGSLILIENIYNVINQLYEYRNNLSIFFFEISIWTFTWSRWFSKTDQIA